MTEVDALLKIADALNAVAIALGSISTVLWLMLIFKNMGGK